MYLYIIATYMKHLFWNKTLLFFAVSGIILLSPDTTLAAPFRPTSLVSAVQTLNGYRAIATPLLMWNAAVQNELPISHYELKTDDGPYVNIGNVTSYTTPALQDGRHTFYLRASDTANHVSDVVTLELGTDTHPPTIGAITPTVATQNTPTIFTIHPIDNIEITGCTYAVNGVSQGNMAVNANWDFSAQVSFSSTGSNNIRTTCLDIAGNYTATDNLISISSQNTPVDTTANYNNSTVYTSKASVEANYSDSAIITVTIRNAAGLALSGKTVSLQSSRPNQDTIINTSPVTNASGIATFTVKSSQVGSSTYRPVVDNEYVTNGINLSYLNLSGISKTYSSTYINKTSVAANNSDYATITVTLRNDSNVVIPNKAILLESTRPTYDSISNASTYTNSSGQATFIVRSWVAGTSVYRPIVDGSYLNNDLTVNYYTTASNANTASSYYSAISPNKSHLVANSGEVSVITVVVRNSSNIPLSNKTITVQTNRSSFDTIIYNSSVTNADGYASFYVRSTQTGTSSYSVYADNSWIGDFTVTYNNAGGVSPTLPSAIPPGTLIKLVCPPYASVNDACRAVYFIGSDNKRHAFSHSKIYFSWYVDFSTVQEVNGVTMSSYMIGKNMGYKPGVRLVKFTSSPVVYAVSANNILRAITSESVAKNLYGAGWAKKIDDISDAFMGDYQFGTAIDSSFSFNPATEAANKPNPLTNGY
ncbi:MAG: hypothetical protein QG607_276 [Patescibacteria group bacterium]|nr:hypothetical protein [Patescibacteria group bacterium]